MRTQKTIQQFIQKRAEGRALHRIADEIGVSKTTLVAWKEKYALEILAAQQDAALEAQTTVRNIIACRQTLLDDSFERLAPIIDNFDPNEVTIMQAFRLFFLIQRETLKLQQLRFKLDLDTAKLHQPIPEPKLPRSSCERSEQRRSSIQRESANEHTISPLMAENADLPIKKSGGLAPAPRKRSNNGQENKKPDHIRDNFLTLIANPPRPAILPQKNETTLVTHAPEEFRLMPSKLSKDTLEIARTILPKELSAPNNNFLFQQPQSIAERAKEFSEAAD